MSKLIFSFAIVLLATLNLNGQSSAKNVSIYISNVASGINVVSNRAKATEKSGMEDTTAKVRTKLGAGDTAENSFRTRLEEDRVKLALRNEAKTESNLSTLSGAKADNNKSYSFYVKYIKQEGTGFKYGMHIEGQVKACEGSGRIPHAYVSINSAIGFGRYEVIPTNTNGWFSADITDDSVGSITLIKKGFEEKDIVLLNNRSKINDSTSYVFDACLDKTDEVENVIVRKIATSTKAANVFFDFNKSLLTDETRQMLDDVINNVKSMGASVKSIDINGYTDKKGSKKYNLALSKERSLACKKYLMMHGLDNVKINVKACGVDEADLQEDPNMGKNRRVDIIVHKVV